MYNIACYKISGFQNICLINNQIIECNVLNKYLTSMVNSVYLQLW